MGLQASPSTLAQFIIFHVFWEVCLCAMTHTWRPENNCPKSVLPSLMWVLELNSSQAWHLAGPPPLKFYFKNTVYNFSEYPLRLKHNCQALFSNSFFLLSFVFLNSFSHSKEKPWIPDPECTSQILRSQVCITMTGSVVFFYSSKIIWLNKHMTAYTRLSKKKFRENTFHYDPHITGRHTINSINPMDS